MPSLSSLAKSLSAQLDQRTSDCALIELGDDDSPVTEGGSQVFQYYPETVSDTKAVNYQQKEIFGASLPLYQWVAGGERLISFSVIFTCDVDLLDFTNQENRDTLYLRLKNAGQERRNVDIRSAVVWLRQYMLPTYQEGAADSSAALTFAPRKLLLSMPGTGIGLAGGDDGLSGLDTVPVLMTQCDVSHEALFPSGLPRITTVQLSFAQTGQIRGAVTFPSRTAFYDASRKGTGLFLGYNFPARGKITFG